MDRNRDQAAPWEADQNPDQDLERDRGRQAKDLGPEMAVPQRMPH